MHEIAKEIRHCTQRCFVDRYESTDYRGRHWSAARIAQGTPLVWSPDGPRVVLVSQAPSLQAWLNGIDNPSPCGGLVSQSNEFLVDDLLPALGLSARDIDVFRDNVFWIHTCNCYPWFRRYDVRQDRKPTQGEAQQCLGRWCQRVTSIPSVKGLVLMGDASTYVFPKVNPDRVKFTDLVRRLQVRTDVVEGVETLPIYHQSRKSRIFNNPTDQAANERLRLLLAAKFREWIRGHRDP